MRLTSQAQAEAIAAAYARMPEPIADRLRHVEFFEGDPIFAGLHRFIATRQKDYSFREIAHCCYPEHIEGPADRRLTTIVLPRLVELDVVVHELGHALHEVLAFEPTPRPVTAYAQTNRWEAFAEAFTAWLCPVEYHNVQDYLYRDAKTVALFRDLARQPIAA